MMKRFFIGALAVLAVQNLALASYPVNVNLIEYYVPTDYQSTSKTDTTVIGTYGYIGYHNHSLELEYDQVSAAQTNTSVQNNSIGIYTYYGIPYNRLKLGVQHMDGVSNPGDMYMIGAANDCVSYYGYKLWTTALDAYVTKYDTVTPIQLSPSLTMYLNRGALISVTTKLNAQYIEESSPKTYATIQTSILCAWKSLTLSTEFTAGESKYGVFNGGFVVFNTADVLKNSVALSATYYATKSLSFTVSREYHELVVSGEDETTDFSKQSFMIGYHF